MLINATSRGELSWRGLGVVIFAESSSLAIRQLFLVEICTSTLAGIPRKSKVGLNFLLVSLISAISLITTRTAALPDLYYTH
jgi:hypothetical protein